VLPAHNAEATIAQAIASTLQQSYADFELWVLENGSNDRTAAIARSFTDPRVKVFELGPVGFQGALQYAIQNTSSEWLARMDADDLMFPDRLQVQMAVIKRRPELVVVGTAFALLTPFDHIFECVLSCKSQELDSDRMGWGRFFADPSAIFKRRTALEVGGVDPEFTIGDVPLWFRLLTRGKGWEIAEPLHLWRIQPHSMSKSADFASQALRARAKYAPQTVNRWPRSLLKGGSGWYLIAGLELLASDGRAVRQAADLLVHESARAAQRLRWLSYWGRVGYICYRWRNRWSHRYRHRPDWEQLFAPLLKQGKQTLQDEEFVGTPAPQRKS
jgi:glycosyltransferase involved in cell wall biosynthesis